MPNSMTGFGRCTVSDNGYEITVEIKSVNHRFLEVSERIPRLVSFLEDYIKKKVQERISRGKVDVNIQVTMTADRQMRIEPDVSVAKGYYSALNTLAEEIGLRANLSVSDISRFPDVLRITPEPVNEELMQDLISRALSGALDCFIAMRRTEGCSLQEDIEARLIAIEQQMITVETNAARFLERYTERLFQKMKTVLESTSIDENRILTEAALYADRAAVDEEIVRIHSHISQLREILASDEPSGRKLDFLIQELNREINTIGSKANDLQITNAVVEIKALVEKIREQIQNIE